MESLRDRAERLQREKTFETRGWDHCKDLLHQSRRDLQASKDEVATLTSALEKAEWTEGEFSRLVKRLERLAQGREMTVSEFAWEVSKARAATQLAKDERNETT